MTYTINTERNMELLREIIAERFYFRHFNESELQMEVGFLLRKLVETGLLEEEFEGDFVLPEMDE